MFRVLLVTVVGVALLAPVPGSSGNAPQQTIAFARGGDIWTIAADGTKLRRLLRNASSPAWSPDGRRILFVSSRSGDDEIYVARADGRGVKRLTRKPGLDLRPDWSSDGKRIAWSHDGAIWRMNADGSDQRVVVAKAQPWHEHVTPTWHRGTIVYASNRVSSFNLELFAAPARRLTFTKGDDGRLGDDGMPDFSPDGQRIVFSSNRDQQGEIYVMNRDGSRQRRLTRTPGDDFTPRFSRDGRQIAFTALPGSVMVMNADGSALRRLTAGTDPDWR